MPHIYGPEHIIYLFVVIVLMGMGFFLINRHVKTEKQLALAIRLIGGLLLIMIIWNRLSIAILRDGFNELLPGSYCGTSSLVLALAAIFLKKDHPVFHCVAYIGLLGGLATLAYPDFIGQADSIFYPMTISGLAHHTVMVFLVVVMLTTGYLKPMFLKWHYAVLGLALYLVYGLFLIKVLGYGEAMCINRPLLDDTNLYCFQLGAIYLPVHAAFLAIWNLVGKKYRIGAMLAKVAS
ncbi:MAG TPA: YwaF family protein [Bacillota bacterium]|nr:YwaF family protein [Bacillota bacterium]HPF41937.1 YwaF family protein [Bacillota bacterium]HPJ85590.1 YwaF family protein [Bacillota bacterium]HPQ61458.1 YwaF family protein [Bacillota bacterium]HRX92236.1 YwaF family protein [Candidatus Izemoplasmatales bacterium]